MTDSIAHTDGHLRFDLGGKVALITAATSGLGRAIALAFAHAGADVVLGVRNLEAGEGLAREIEAVGRRALAVELDVTRPEEIDRAITSGLEAFGQIDCLINNAGIGPGNPAELVTEEDFNLTCDVNLKGTFFVSQAVGRQMIRQGAGCIVNIGSQAGFVALPNESVYCMTKAAISHLTKCLAIEWGVHGITVNAVAPTWITTPGTEPYLRDSTIRGDILERIAGLHRIGTPDDVTGAVVFLASPAASLITGHTILIDGGWTAR